MSEDNVKVSLIKSKYNSWNIYPESFIRKDCEDYGRKDGVYPFGLSYTFLNSKINIRKGTSFKTASKLLLEFLEDARKKQRKGKLDSL
jgi:hypothetical protein